MARILIVEDEPNNRAIATTILRNVGHTVEEVATGKEALEALERAAFDIILMDVLMPVMDGITATRVIRSDERFSRLPILGLTARAGAEDQREMLAAGMNAVITKPYRNQHLRLAVEDVLRRGPAGG